MEVVSEYLYLGYVVTPDSNHEAEIPTMRKEKNGGECIHQAYPDNEWQLTIVPEEESV